MQTFLPYPDFEMSAQVLDYRRLGKQRVEVLQLLTALRTGPEQWVAIKGEYDETEGKYEEAKIKRVTPWFNHPAAKMWRGYEHALCEYGLSIVQEWIERGYKDTCYDKIMNVLLELPYSGLPPWLGNEDFHAAHRSNLLRKDPVHYGQFGWTESNDLPYIWPV